MGRRNNRKEKRERALDSVGIKTWRRTLRTKQLTYSVRPLAREEEKAEEIGIYVNKEGQLQNKETE